jgi:hypothetical protein
MTRSAPIRTAHARQQRLVVLQVAVHHGDGARGRGEHALDAGAGQALAADAPQTAHARVGTCDGADDPGRAIWAVVVDEDHFPLRAC